ncbi:MAG TPA: hypothetical protein VI320_36725 [Terracidiphilus sp.]|jgi:hypothetical protein
MPPLSELSGPEVTNLGDLVGILNAGDLNAGWFQNVFGELEQMPQRLAELLALIDRLSGPPQAGSPAVFPGAQYFKYRIDDRGAFRFCYRPLTVLSEMVCPTAARMIGLSSS